MWRPRRRADRYHPLHMPDLVIVLVVILILVLLWRGPKTLPQLGEALGRGVKEARQAARTEEDEERDRAARAAEDERRA
jgi:TatA/E family protein of Tat protein translocase